MYSFIQSSHYEWDRIKMLHVYHDKTLKDWPMFLKQICFLKNPLTLLRLTMEKAFIDTDISHEVLSHHEVNVSLECIL